MPDKSQNPNGDSMQGSKPQLFVGNNPRLVSWGTTNTHAQTPWSHNHVCEQQPAANPGRSTLQPTEHGGHRLRCPQLLQTPTRSVALDICCSLWLTEPIWEKTRKVKSNVLLTLKLSPRWFSGTYCPAWCSLLYYCQGVPRICFFFSQFTTVISGQWNHLSFWMDFCIALLEEITKPKHCFTLRLSKWSFLLPSKWNILLFQYLPLLSFSSPPPKPKYSAWTPL